MGEMVECGQSKGSDMERQIGRYASRWVGAGFACVAVLVASTGLLHGQAKSTAGADKPSGATQLGKRDYRFEVASVRPADPPSGLHFNSPQFSPGRFRDEHDSLVGLAMQAFQTRGRYDIQFKDSMRSDYFAVNATVPEGATKADLPIMIQHLLEDRFGLVFHHEMRTMDGYELVVAKSGPRLTPSATPASEQSAAKGPPIELKNGDLQFTKNGGSGMMSSGMTSTWRGRNKTMASLATDLGYQYGAPVKDATGLHGEYDFTLTFTSDAYMRPGSDASPAGDDVPPGYPLLRSALQKQLGLELVPVKNVAVDVVVLDSARTQPTEN
jgi:uncharacterized protein (TIGR03435 family)